MSGWVRLEANIDNHPEVQDAGPWGLVAFQVLLRIAKEHGEAGFVSEKYALGKHLARRSLFDPAQYAPVFDQAVNSLEEAGLVERVEGGLRIPGWGKFQNDPTNSTRQQAHRDRKRQDSQEHTSGVTDGNGCHRDVTRVTPVTVDGTGRDGTGRDGTRTPPPSSPVGRREPEEEEDSRPISARANQGPQTPTPATDARQLSPSAPPTTADDCRPRKAAPRRQQRRDAAPVDESSAVVGLWNTAAAAAGCPPAPPAEDLGPATRQRCAELLQRHGQDGMRQAFAKVAASDFLSGRSGLAKYPWTLQRVLAPEAWGRLLAGDFDARRAGPATGQGEAARRPSAYAGLEQLEFESEELRRFALNPHNGLEPHEIRALALSGRNEEAAS